jgi:hypothetical protein
MHARPPRLGAPRLPAVNAVIHLAPARPLSAGSCLRAPRSGAARPMLAPLCRPGGSSCRFNSVPSNTSAQCRSGSVTGHRSATGTTTRGNPRRCRCVNATQLGAPSLSISEPPRSRRRSKQRIREVSAVFCEDVRAEEQLVNCPDQRQPGQNRIVRKVPAPSPRESRMHRVFRTRVTRVTFLGTVRLNQGRCRSRTGSDETPMVERDGRRETWGHRGKEPV